MKSNQTLTFDEATHTYRLSPSGVVVPGVSEVISSVFPFMGQGPAVNRACRFGEAAHKAIELDIADNLDMASVDPAILSYLNQMKTFIWANKIKIIDTEVMLYSKKYNFAGRVDVVSDKYVIDIKTGQKSPTHKIQCAAYRHLVNCNQKEKIKESLIVYLDGSDKLPIGEEERPSDLGV